MSGVAYHAVFPRPQIGHSILVVVRLEGSLSGIRLVSCPSLSDALACAKRNPSNASGFEYLDGSRIIARCGMHTHSPFSTTEPSCRLKF